jgi:hypothetical protein
MRSRYDSLGRVIVTVGPLPLAPTGFHSSCILRKAVSTGAEGLRKGFGREDAAEGQRQFHRIEGRFRHARFL